MVKIGGQVHRECMMQRDLNANEFFAGELHLAVWALGRHGK